VYGLYDVTGDSPLRLGVTADLVANVPEILWWRLYGVRYAVIDRPLESAPVAELARSEKAVLYEVQLPAPPAWVPARTVCPEAGEVARGSSGEVTGPPARWWARADFDPLAQVAFEYPVDASRERFGDQRGADEPGDVEPLRAAQDCGNAAPSPIQGATARLTALDPGRAVVEATMPGEGWLVWSNAFDPGWRALAMAADGRTLEPSVLPAYGALTAVRLPAGDWRVEWTYRPNTIIVGLLVSLSTLGLAMMLGVSSWRRESW